MHLDRHAERRRSVSVSSRRDSWDRDGFLVIREVLEPSAAAALAREVEKLSSQVELIPVALRGDGGNERDVNVLDAHRLIPELVALVDNPISLPIIVEVMGPHLQVGSIETMYRVAHPLDLMSLHTDGGPSLRNISLKPGEFPLQAKLQVFLTPVAGVGTGRFRCVPGSQQVPLTAERMQAAEAQAVGIDVDAGDAILFPWSLWHGVEAKQTESARISVIVRYVQSWARQAFRLNAPLASELNVMQRLLLEPQSADPESGGEYFYKKFRIPV